MENDIIIISDHIEIHPNEDDNQWFVVRDGAVYGGPYDLDFARKVAQSLAA